VAVTTATAAIAIPSAWALTPGTVYLVSEERLLQNDLPTGAILLRGPRLDRLQKMRSVLRTSHGAALVLDLDGADDHLLAVAADLAQVRVLRGTSRTPGDMIVHRVRFLQKELAA
jgi:hypothetical protein